MNFFSGTKFQDSPIPEAWERLLLEDKETVSEQNPTSRTQERVQTYRLSFIGKCHCKEPLHRKDTFFIRELWAQPLGKMYRIQDEMVGNNYFASEFNQQSNISALLSQEKRFLLYTVPLFGIKCPSEDYQRLQHLSDISLPRFNNLESILFHQGLPVGTALFHASPGAIVGKIKNMWRV